jgi:subtilase family serine protease
MQATGFVSVAKNTQGDRMKLAARVGSLFVLAFSVVTFPHGAWAQTPARPVAQRITAAIDGQNLTTLHGNVHPLARGEFDRGAAADAQTLHRMLLLLKRSPEQESALQELLNDQQSKSSERYQNWLTPAEFGAQFGPADADIQAVTQWLESQGFSGLVVSAGRTTIEFSGNAGQVRNAFHTEIRRYAIKGETHFANASDPAIPAALAPVVAGVVSLNNFPIQSHLHRLGTFQKSLKTGETRPLFTFPGCGSNCFGVGPADFAKIYNSQPLLSGSPKIDGTGQGIAIVGESNINVQDVKDFRTMFGLSQNFSTSNVILNGPDPGIADEEGEADLDVQWSGAVAPGARIDFVTSASTETTAGINLSAVYIVDHNLDAVMSESFGGCEKFLGTTFNQFFNALWEQASAQGITVVVSAGDNGSAGCDDFTSAQTATQGLAVSGFASTPFNVAVGGTEFDQANKQSTYWNTTATTTTPPVPASAKSYIPEIPWNDTCAQSGISGCTAANVNGISGGSGGVSTLYSKPSWQTGKGVPADGHRDLPDVSLFASNGFNGSFYTICQSDVTGASSCNLNGFQFTFQGVGGTSASAPAFAGIMALVNQKLANGSNPTPRQGNANYYLYALAQQQNTANLSCNSSSSPVASCSFNDVTKGNNDVPCTGASTNCSSHVASTPGVLVTAASPTTPAFTTTAGYDAATGLGSLNVQNVVNQWSSVNTTATTTALILNGGSAVNTTHGQTLPYQISVGPSTASGDASLIATPTGNTVGIGPFTLTGGAVSGTTSGLPGGTSYNVVAHYEGNGTDAPSDSSPVTVTVAPEASKVFVTVPTFNPNTGQQNGTTPTTVVYGSPYLLRADVTNATGSLSTPFKPPSCPSGTITFADTIGGVGQGAPNSGTFALNSSGYTEDLPVQFPGGTNVIAATYSGDGSFSPPAQATTYTLHVTPCRHRWPMPSHPQTRCW